MSKPTRLIGNFDRFSNLFFAERIPGPGEKVHLEFTLVGHPWSTHHYIAFGLKMFTPEHMESIGADVTFVEYSK